MAWRELAIALIMVAGAVPVSASQPLESPRQGAPEAPADARYCLKVEAATGTRLETVQCWTRAEWAEMEIDVDQEWAKEGVRVIA
ncbi:MAG: hypothetical protein H0W71_02640 [Sphingomonas sp.]|nr:hypothetical protein [Sphingomonas sp.]